MNVLIIDDDPLVRRAFGFAVSLGGWTAFTHDQYADCAKLIAEHGIDVLLTDYQMPPTNGLDLIDKLRSLGIRIPVLIVSANAHAIDSNRAKRLDVFRILSKPTDVKELRNALTEAVANGCDKSATPARSKIRLTLSGESALHFSGGVRIFPADLPMPCDRTAITSDSPASSFR